MKSKNLKIESSLENSATQALIDAAKDAKRLAKFHNTKLITRKAGINKRSKKAKSSQS